MPADYVQEALRTAAQILKSWRELKKLGVAEKLPRVEKSTVVVHPQCWRLDSGSVQIAVESDGKKCKYVEVRFEAHRHFLRYFDDPEWELCKELRFKVFGGGVLLYFSFEKPRPQTYEPRGWLSVDVNENSVAVLLDGRVLLFKTGFSSTTKVYYWKRRKLQSFYDEKYGSGSRALRKKMKHFRERERKRDWRRKIARIVVGEAFRRRYGIILEKLTPKSVWGMLSHIKSKKLKLRITRACFLGVIKEIKRYAALYGVPILEVNPAYTSKTCPLHGCELEYNGNRTATCPIGGETWHREVSGTFNIMRKGGAPIPDEPVVPIVIAREVWTRARSLNHALELARHEKPKAAKLAVKYERYIEALRRA